MFATNQPALDDLANYLASFRFRFVTEKDLQDGIEAALTAKKLLYQREAAISLKDRPDFLLASGIAIEVKIKGSMAELLRQASRYAQQPGIAAILVAGTPHWLPRVPASLCGKPVRSIRLIGSLL